MNGRLFAAAGRTRACRCGALAALLLALFLSGCARHGGADPVLFGLPDGAVCADIDLLPQDLTGYAARAGADRRLMAPERQAREDARFNARFFAAWQQGLSRLPEQDVFEAATGLKPSAGFAENLRPWDAARWQALLDNCRKEAYGSSPVLPAITVTTTALRRLPTNAPFFLNPGRAGEGFPFDYLQNSVLWPGTPAAVTHRSRDGQWVFVQTSLVSGWARAEHLARVDAAFMDRWRARPLAVVVEDSLALPVSGGPADALTGAPRAVTVQVGTILPVAAGSGAADGTILLLAPMRRDDGTAVAVSLPAPAPAARPKPLPLTPGEVARVGNAMMGQPYGWGGLFAQRDCSAMLHDLFATFGIWLPRNSRAQGRTGSVLPLGNLSPDAREERIMRDGIPFFSLVAMPGHIGLYLGPHPLYGRDVPVMFHNVWGLRLMQGQGAAATEGRAVIGKAVVTSLRPGAEHEAIATPASILDRITGLAVLPEPFSGEVPGRSAP